MCYSGHMENKRVCMRNFANNRCGLLFRLGFLLAIGSFIPTTGVLAQSRNSAESLQNSFREVSSDVLPVVVQVNTVSVIDRRITNPFEFFFRFPDRSDQFRSPGEEPFSQKGLGSGVIVERRKNKVYILTNNHVVANADKIEINLHDGRTFEGELVGGDPLRDLALIYFETRDEIPIAVLGDSDEVRVGDWVLAVGNPLGFESTVTAGIISAKGRSGTSHGFTDYLQTDASINQGNSGGALVNLNGKVIGINTFIASTSGGNIGLGFAIPINNALKAIDDFIEKGSVEYAWLGVNMDDLNEDLKAELELEDKEGAFVFNVYNKSPAMKAGILPGDYIIRLAGRAIESSDDLIGTVAALSPGETVPLVLIRQGSTTELNLRLAERTIDKDETKVGVWPGFSVVPITSQLRERMKISRSLGNVLIWNVVSESSASELGLRGGDIIRAINGKNVRDLKHFYELLNSGNRIEIKINRMGSTLEFILNK